MTPKARKSAYQMIVEQRIFNSPLSANLPALTIIAEQWGLKLNRKRDWDIAVRILINYVKNN
jgi:hypothetical protein